MLIYRKGVVWLSKFCSLSISIFLLLVIQSFPELKHKPQLVDLTVEEGQRLKVVYGSSMGFHAIDLDTSSVFDLYIPSHVSSLPLSRTLLCMCMWSLWRNISPICNSLIRGQFYEDTCAGAKYSIATYSVKISKLPVTICNDGKFFNRS